MNNAAWGAPQPAISTDEALAELAAQAEYNPNQIIEDASHPLHAAWLAKRDVLLKTRDDAKDVAAKAKESEMEARKAVQAFAFGKAVKEGMNNQPLANGFELKFGNKLNYGFKASNEQIDKAEDAAAQAGNRGSFLFERIVTWKPEFSKTEYNKLDITDPTDKKIKELIDELLDIKQATGSLEIKAPKAKLNG